ncbi:MAG: DNA polymerase III subunit gamma/tau, partial [Candidatus Omnitrophota bacterium]
FGKFPDNGIRMSASEYIVSALKFRPSSFSEVLAQDHVIQTLKNSLRRGQIANAFLLVGPRGTGKTTTARILAKAMNCENPQDAEPCNQCSSCLAVNKGTHSDVLEIDAASNRGIDEIKALRENVRFTPAFGKYKVYIIDEVHMLTPQANNAFLKTLEEPPSHVRFILATTELNKILPTILSRCQRFQFRRIPHKVIVEHLKKIVSNRKEIQFASAAERDGVLYLIARKSEGGLRDALFFLDQIVAFSSGKIQLAEVEDALGVIEFDVIDRFISAVLRHDLPTILGLMEQANVRGKDFLSFLIEGLHHLRRLAVIKVSEANANLLDLPDEYIQQILQSAKQASLEQILYATDIFWEAERRMKNSSEGRIILEMAAIKAAKASQAVKIEDVLKALSTFSGASSSIVSPPPAIPAPTVSHAVAPTAKPKPQPELLLSNDLYDAVEDDGEPEAASAPEAAPIASPAVLTASLASMWTHFLNEVEKNPVIASALDGSVLLAFDNGSIQVGIPAENSLFNIKALENEKNRKTISQIVEKVFGKTLRIRYETRGDIHPTHEHPGAAPEIKKKEPNKKELLDKAQSDKMFCKLMDELPGRIVSIKPFKEG